MVPSSELALWPRGWRGAVFVGCESPELCQLQQLGSAVRRQEGPSPPNNGSPAPLSALAQPPCPRKLLQQWGGGHSQCLGVRAPCALSPRGSRSAALVAQQNPGWIAPGDLEEFPLWSWCCVLALLFSAALILLILPPLFPPPPPPPEILNQL